MMRESRVSAAPRRKKSNKIKMNQSVLMWVFTLIIGAWCLLMLLMLFWALMTGFKGRFDFRDNPVGFPKEFVWNLPKGLEYMYVSVNTASGPKNVYAMGQFGNSVLLMLIGTFSTLTAVFIMSYITSRYKFVGNDFIYGLNIAVMLVPIFGSLPAELQMVRALGLYDRFWGIFIMKFTFQGSNFLILRTIFKTVPRDYYDAARIDGAGHFSQMLRIGLPMCSSTIFALMILSLIGYWSDYNTMLIYLPSHPVIAYGLFQMQFSTRTEITIPIIMSVAMTLALPMTLTFFVFRNKILGNIRIGGLKG